MENVKIKYVNDNLAYFRFLKTYFRSEKLKDI